jgi:hypothetical protein
MPEFIVAIDHITYDAVEAGDEVTAIDLVLEGEGLEISSETRDACISEYESREPRRHASSWGGPSPEPCHADLQVMHALYDHDSNARHRTREEHRPMLTEREIRLITYYADMIRDEALGVAAQQAVSDYGTDADRANPTMQTVLRELREAGYR